MFTKIAIICSLACVASALSPGYVNSQYALGSQAEHTVRGFAGLSSVSKQAKAVDSPYSTVRKTDVRVTNDAAYAPAAAVTYAHPGHAYATPAFAHHGYAAPAQVTHLTHSGPYHVSAGGIAYAQPTYTHAQPTYTHAHPGYAQIHHAAPTHAVAHHPIGYHGATITSSAPLKTVQKTVATVPHGLGVAYSPASAVAHATFSGFGVHYGY